MGQQPYWKLTVRDGSKPSFVVMLACGDKVVVGRSRTCEIVLSDLSVSRKHCFFGVSGDGALKVADFGALHPTLLNGVIVKEGCAVPVLDGYQVRLGRGSFITVECLSEKRPSRVDDVDPVVDDDLQHTHAKVSEESVPVKVAEVALADDPFNNGEIRCSDNKKTNEPEGGIPHADIVQPVSLEGDVEENSNHHNLDEKSPIHAPQHASTKSVRVPVQQDKTSLVDLKGVSKQLRPDTLIPPKIDGRAPVPKGAALVGDDNGDLNVDEATKLVHVNASKQSGTKKVKRPALREDANQNHTEVLGEALQEKLSQPEKSKPDPVLNNTVRNGSDDGVLNSDEAIITSSPGGGAQDETNYVDPAELQRLMQGKAGSLGKKGGKKGATPKESSRKGDESENTTPTDGDLQDETNYVDPVELQKLMKGKAGSLSKKGGKKGATPKGSSRTVDEAEKTALSDGDPQDETNYIDPAELQKLMKGKAGTFGKTKGGNGAPSAADSQDETGYIDPAELQRLMKGKAGLFGKKGGKKRTAKGTSRKGEDAGNTAPPAGDSGDETGYVDPAELQKLMKGKAGLFGKKGGKKRTAPRGTARKGEDAGNTAPPDGDSQDETNFIDPAELQKLMKGKAKSPRSNKGRSR